MYIISYIYIYKYYFMYIYKYYFMYIISCTVYYFVYIYYFAYINNVIFYAILTKMKWNKGRVESSRVEKCSTRLLCCFPYTQAEQTGFSEHSYCFNDYVYLLFFIMFHVIQKWIFFIIFHVMQKWLFFIIFHVIQKWILFIIFHVTWKWIYFFVVINWNQTTFLTETSFCWRRKIFERILFFHVMKILLSSI